MTTAPPHEISPPFGTYAPTPAQARIIRWFHDTPLGGTRLRRPAVRRFQSDRAGPVDSRLFGLNVRFHPQDNTTDAKAAVCGERCNRRELDCLRQALPQDLQESVFVDVGANMGFFSLFAAGRGARVLAMEPNPILFARLGVNLGLNGFNDALLAPVAVGEAEGTVRLSIDRDDLGTGRAGGDGELEAAVRPLLSLVQEAGLTRIDVLKIDIEGYEDRALGPFFEGAPEALRPRHLLMEHSSAADWRYDLQGLLDRSGYRLRAKTRGNSWLERTP